jgi:hypothetical protein
MVLGRERTVVCDDFSFDLRCSRHALCTEEDEMKVPLLKICELSFLFAGLSITQAQQSIGTVGVQDATVAGALEVSNGRAILVGNTTVTARDRTADIALNRGGSVKVCATSGLHLTAGKGEGTLATPLMLALDRGAIEVQMAATTRDVVMTPDLRFTMRTDAPLDLQLRVTRNGDTCVENRGAQAPVLNVADQFGEAAYELRAGQHVLFEHGSLKEVVDHESSSCGCPPEATMSVADALLHPAGSGTGAGNGDAASTPKPATEEHPFPAAVSAGLAPPSAVPAAPAGAPHTQVSAALSSNEGVDSLAVPKATEKAPTSASAPAVAGAPASAPAPAAVSAPAAASVPVATAPVTDEQRQAPSEPKHDLVHAIGRFFKHIFGSG